MGAAVDEKEKGDTPAEKTIAEVYVELHRMVSVIRGHRRMPVAAVYEKFGGPGIKREYRKCLDEMNRELGGEG